jgi:hypothetical protein
MYHIQICKLGGFEFSYSLSTIEEVLPVMEKNGFKLCSLEDIARLRIAQSMYNSKKSDAIFDNGPILTREAVLCFPGSPPIARLVKDSPLLFPSAEYIPDKGIVIKPAKMVRAREIVGFTRREVCDSAIKKLEETNFFPKENYIINSLENSIKFSIAEQGVFSKFIDVENLKKDELISSVFGAQIDLYQKSLIMSGIRGIRVYPENSESINAFEKPFVRQLIYGRDETADICLHSGIIFADSEFYIFGIRE